MKKQTLFISLLLLTTPALAQQNQGQNQGGQGQRQFQIDPAQRARMQAFQPVLDLSRTLRMLPELHKQKGLAITRTQASKLIPIIKDIQTRKSLKPQDADTLLGKIEGVLTDPQLTWIDKQQIRRPGQGGQNGQNAQGGQTGQNRQGGQFQGNGQNGQGGQNRQGGQGGNRGFGGFQTMMTASNPFTVEPFKGQVTALMGVLQKIK